LGHPFPQRHNQIFERLHDENRFEVHVFRFRLYEIPRLRTNLHIHEPNDIKVQSAVKYYLFNLVNHVFELRRILKKEDVDVIVLSNLAMPFAYTLVENLSGLGVPFIFDLPDYYPTSATGYLVNKNSIISGLLTKTLDLMLRHMMRRATTVTMASKALLDYSLRAGIDNGVLVPNGVSECFLRLYESQDLRERLGFSNDDFVVGYIGSVEFWLEMKNLIKGVALAKKNGLPIKLLIVGRSLRTNYSKKVMNWIKDFHLDRQTTWLDFIRHEDVPKYIAAMDVGTIPFDVSNSTAYYASPNKIWEYFSQKKPIISSPIPEAINNKDCLLIASTPEDYVKNLTSVFRAEEEVFSKTQIGYKKALENTWEHSKEIFARILIEKIGSKKN